MDRSVWLVTGGSTGFGLAAVNELLKQGYKVATTTRSESRLRENLGPCDDSRLLVLEVDLKNDDEIKKAVDSTISHFGQLDVVLNNAGFGQIGAIEELSKQAIMEEFEINVFAAHAFIKYSLPHFRSRMNGYYLTVSSISAFCPPTGLGIYAASKAAITAITEAIGDEAGHLGIKVTSVEPGPFQTNFTKAMAQTDENISEYRQIHETLDRMKVNATRRPGDPARAAKLFIELAKCPDPPRRIFPGKIAINLAEQKISKITKDLATWRSQCLATDFE
jgi:NAD(P)-dependent dehydrogenase (short-subunit alcohol dehydrogenase family)